MNPAPLRCCICQQPLRGLADSQRIRDRSLGITSVRCIDREHCTLRAARNRRIEIGMEDEKPNAAS